jgi:hypothetical protein
VIIINKRMTVRAGFQCWFCPDTAQREETVLKRPYDYYTQEILKLKLLDLSDPRLQSPGTAYPRGDWHYR